MDVGLATWCILWNKSVQSLHNIIKPNNVLLMLELNTTCSGKSGFLKGAPDGSQGEKCELHMASTA